MKLCKFLELYKEYTAGNETPEIIHIWIGLATLAGAVEGRVWLARGFFKIFLNLYLLIIAPPGVCAKSTSMGLSQDLLQEAGLSVFSSSSTKAQLVIDMTESLKVYDPPDGQGDPYQHCSITYYTDEFNVLLDAGGASMVKFLTTIFSLNRDYSDRTKSAGSYTIVNPWLNIVAATVPKWFSSSLASDADATGLLSRFIILYETRKRGRIAHPRVTPAQLHARQHLLETIFELGAMFGEVKETKAAYHFYEEWYEKQRPDLRDDERLVEYFERKVKLHVPKVAALMAIGDGRMVMDVKDYERAITLLDGIDHRLRAIYRMSGENKYAQYIVRIQTLLASAGGRVRMRDLLQIFCPQLRLDEFKAVVEQIEEMEIAKRRRVHGELFLVANGSES